MAETNEKNLNPHQKPKLGSTSAIAAAIFPTPWTWPRFASRPARCRGWWWPGTHMFMCSDPGQELIIEDLQSGRGGPGGGGLLFAQPARNHVPQRPGPGRGQSLRLRTGQPAGAGELGAPWRRGHREGQPAGGRGRGQGREAQAPGTHPGRGRAPGGGARGRRSRAQERPGTGRAWPAGDPGGEEPLPGGTGGAVAAPGA